MRETDGASTIEFREIRGGRMPPWHRRSMTPGPVLAIVATAVAVGLLFGVIFSALLFAFAALSLLNWYQTGRTTLIAPGWLCVAVGTYGVAHVEIITANATVDMATFLVSLGAAGVVASIRGRGAAWKYVVISGLCLVACGLVVAALGAGAAAFLLASSSVLLAALPVIMVLSVALFYFRLRLIRSVLTLRRPLIAPVVVIYMTVALSGWTYHHAVDLTASQGPAAAPALFHPPS